jgi:hypothetical protein
VSIIQLMGSGDMTPAADAYSAFLTEALPLNFKYGFTDQSYRIRGAGGPASVVYNSSAYQPEMVISSLNSKFYGSSAKEPQTSPAGTTFHASQLDVDTGASNTIGTQNYCYEFWWYSQDFNFAGLVNYTLNYNSVSTGGAGLTSGDVPHITIKGDNWVNTAPYQRGIWVGGGPNTTFFYETTSQCLLPNTWHHIAVTRSGTTGRIFVDGVLQATGTDSRNYAGYVNVHGVCNRTLGSGMYLQDIRCYVGTAKYTSNFTVPGPIFL